MKLNQLNLLLLLTVIHSATGSPNKGASCGASGDQDKKGKFKECLRSNCGNMLQACINDDKCKENLGCILDSETLTDSFNCGAKKDVRYLFNCAAKAKCFGPKQETCPGEIQPNLDNRDKPSLVEEIAKYTWMAVLSAGKKKNGFLDYPCNRLGVQGNASHLHVDLSVCLGNTTTGICDTDYLEFSGDGNQDGDKWILKTKLRDGPFVLKETYFHLHIHAYEEGKFFLATGCREGPAQTYLGYPILFSTYATYDELLRNSDDPQSTEAYIRRIFTLLGENYDEAHRINTEKCTN